MQNDTTTLEALSSAQYANLTTFRKNGIAVPTPIWFAIYEPTGVIYIETSATSGKVKRIRHTQRVTLAQCTARGKVTGETIEGHAYIVTETEEIFIAKGALNSKYGFKRQALYSVMTLIDMIRCAPDTEDSYIAIELTGK